MGTTSGYVLGAHEIDEAHAIIELISGIHADPAILWTLAEVFIINNDTRRHLSAFAKIQAEILNRMHASSFPLLVATRNRLTELITLEGLMPYIDDYFSTLKTTLCDDEFKMLQGHLLKKGIKYGLPDDEREKKKDIKEGDGDKDDLDDFSFMGMGRLSNLRKLPGIIEAALRELNIENKPEAREILVKGLEILHQGKSDVWMGKSLSAELGKLFDILLDICTADEFVRIMKTFIVNHHTSDWRVADSLIEMIGGKLKEESAGQLIEVIKEHIRLMIRPDENATCEYSWLEVKSNDIIDEDEELCRLLIWLLNHPYKIIKERVVKSIQLLARLEPAKIIPLLIEEAVGQKPIMSSELSALALVGIAQSEPASIWRSIRGNRELYEKIIEIRHFMIRQYFMKALVWMEQIGDGESTELYRSVSTSIPKSIILQGKIIFNEPYLRPVKYILDPLNELLVLTEEFRENLVKMIYDNCSPLIISDQIRADLFVRRSFFDKDIQFERYQYLLRHAINCCITPRIDRSNLREVEDILRLPFTYED